MKLAYQQQQQYERYSSLTRWLAATASPGRKDDGEGSSSDESGELFPLKSKPSSNNNKVTNLRKLAKRKDYREHIIGVSVQMGGLLNELIDQAYDRAQERVSAAMREAPVVHARVPAWK